MASALFQVNREGNRVFVRKKDFLAWWPTKGHVYYAIGVGVALLYALDHWGGMPAAFLGGALLASSVIVHKALTARALRQGFWFEANRWGFTGFADTRLGNLLKDPTFDVEAAANATMVRGEFGRWLLVPCPGHEGGHVEIRVPFGEEFLVFLRDFARLAA